MASPPRTRTWRKRLTRAGGRAILCLLLGAVTTVGVAWGCWLYSPAPASQASPLASIASLPPLRISHGPWPAPVPDWWEIETCSITRARLTGRFGVSEPIAFYVGEEGHELRELVQRATLIGWPAQSLCASELEWVDTATSRQPRQTLEYQWLLLGSSLPRLPAGLIFPGFLLNTLFYAAPWWLILITPGVIRRFRRRRRGRCIYCGYDLTGLPRDDNTTPTCPECGA